MPNGRVCWVSTPPPQKVMRSPKVALSVFGSMSVAEIWTGLMMSKPQSMKLSMNGNTAPQECLKVFQQVLAWIQSFMR